MKYMKRANIYQASNYNVTFDPNKIEARSYRWWVFVAKVEGKIIFNNYRYSNSTSKHQSKVRSLLNELNIKIDVEMPVPKGLNGSNAKGCYGVLDLVKRNDLTLADLIQEAEEYLCDKFLADQLKIQERNAKARQRRFEKKLEHYLENVVHFRDYDIESVERFGKINKVAVHQVVDMKSMESDVENALHSFHRDGFGSVVFYVGEVQGE